MCIPGQAEGGALQATAQLKEAVKDPLIIPALCDVLRGAQDMQIRQFAAVLLRRRLTKHWKLIPKEQQENLKSLLLEAIQREPEHKVRYALAQLTAVILRNEKLEHWPQFIQFVLQTSRSAVPEHRQVGLLVLKCALDLSAELFKTHFPDLIKMFHHTLNDLQNPPVLFYTLQSLTSVVPEMASNEINLLRSLIAKILTAIRHLIQSNEVQACEAMEVFDELMEGEVSVVVHHLAEIIPFCLELAVNTSLSDNLRVKALSCLSFLIKLKSKSILKQKLLTPILSALFPIMCVEPPPGQMDPEDQEDESEILEEETEVQTPKHFAVQVIDMLALHLPPEKLFPQLTPLMEPCLLSSNPYQRKAGLMCLGVLSEGCAEHIRSKHLKSMLKVVCEALSNESQVVRNAALFALGQFSQNLQPDISEYSDSVLPLLLGYISQVDPSHTAHLTKAYYALENFVENLGSKIEPYLPTLMERILVSLDNSNSNRVKELSVSALGAIANGAEKLLLPYFSSVMESLKVHLVQTGEEGKHIQIQCLETLGVLVRNLGKDAFLPLAEDCCLLGLGLCDRMDDPDMRRCAYSLFAALSGIMEDSISVHLEKMTTLMLLSLKSKEGIVVHYSENRTFMLFEDEADEDDVIQDAEEEEEDPDIEGFSVENSYIEEKEDACLALGEIAYNASSSFFPYLDSCFKEMSKHIESPYTGVRKAAYDALGQLVRSMNNVCKKNPSEANTAALLCLLSLLIPPCLHGALHDKERAVVMSILDTLNHLLKEVKELCIREPSQLENLCTVIQAVLQCKTLCQDPDADDEDEQQAEMDSMLIEYAGEGIPLIAAAVGGATFAPYFAGFLPLLLNKVKPICSPAEKSFAVGTLAESVVAIGPATVQFVQQILPAFITGVRDEDNEVRSNSVFGLGVLAEHGGDIIQQQYPKLLSILSSIISCEKNARVMDNVCGAVSRMVLSHPNGVPLEQVFPVMLRSMPLKEDFEENTTVFKCIAFLYENFTSQVITQLAEIARIFGHCLGTKEIQPDTENCLILLLRDIAQKFPQDFHNALKSVPAEAASKLSAVLGPA
ncbi:importin-4 [Pelobates cultripes]|uniref:Importin-4 n=1 Tax=Pelobates cultripes TaxID=61616 RepID=A0AAD1S935_PELCU|nr:importin-4 [Pelobates cultripes]